MQPSSGETFIMAQPPASAKINAQVSTIRWSGERPRRNDTQETAENIGDEKHSKILDDRRSMSCHPPEPSLLAAMAAETEKARRATASSSATTWISVLTKGPFA